MGFFESSFSERLDKAFRCIKWSVRRISCEVAKEWIGACLIYKVYCLIKKDIFPVPCCIYSLTITDEGGIKMLERSPLISGAPVKSSLFRSWLITQMPFSNKAGFISSGFEELGKLSHLGEVVALVQWCE